MLRLEIYFRNNRKNTSNEQSVGGEVDYYYRTVAVKSSCDLLPTKCNQHVLIAATVCCTHYSSAIVNEDI